MQDETAADMDLGGEAAPAEGEPSPDVFADVPADGGIEDGEPAPPPPAEGSLGGDGATLDELGSEEQLGEEAPINGDGEESALPEQPSDPLADTPAPDPEPTPAEDPPAEPEPEPTPEPAPAADEPKGEAKAKPKGKGGGKKGTTERTYVVLKQDEGGWSEAIEGGVKAANAEAAIRMAYSELVAEDSGDAITLAVIPEHYWNPKTVQAKVRHERAVEIS